MLKTHKGILQRVKREKNLRKSLGKGKISVSQIKMRKKAKKKICFFDYKKPKKGKGTPIKSSEGKKIEQTPRMVREVREERERKTHTTLHYTTRIIQPRNEKTTKRLFVLLLLDGEQLFYLNINM